MTSDLAMAPFAPLALVVPAGAPSVGGLVRLLVGLLGVALAALVVAARGRLGRLVGSSLFRRWCTWAVVGPLFGGALVAGLAAFAALMALVAAVGAREYARLVGLRGADRVLVVAGCGALPVAALVGERWLLVGLVAGFLLATLPTLLAGDAAAGPLRVGAAGFGLLYLGLSTGSMVELAAGPRGVGLLVPVGLAVALSDVGAFCVGRLFGHRALAPRLSPNKTWAGAVGNLVGAALGLALLGAWLPNPAWVVVLAPVVAVGALWGDLLESCLKRAAGVKDSGACLPGFGGVLDRVDSLLVVGSLVWLVAAVLP